MMRDERRRRRQRMHKKNRSNLAILMAVLASLSIAAYLFMAYQAAVSGGDTPNLMGAAAVLFMILSLICLYYGGREFRLGTYSRSSRLPGLLLPLVASFLWLGTYILGILS
nr:hypothetical protein [uncultured Shuttleworthia sp.]